ncbi:hypothetical protein J1605_022548 [Eschrichtius robustus]|uniref:Collagen alpha-1(I) chain-like n=1 Tax=Eschrichtius robustus TaxID=9764 RepID=A0AB34HCA2_ESCRO|nr:hypothetical protein J1605_022548 [Eschrichtius robustus]
MRGVLGDRGNFSWTAGPKASLLPEGLDAIEGTLRGVSRRGGGDETRRSLPSSAQMGDARRQPFGGRARGRGRRRGAGPALPSPLPAGGGARARRPAAPPPPPPPRQAEAARGWWRRWRRQPGGRGRSARPAPSLLPREAEETLSRAAAPRPVDSLRQEHGGPEQRRACEVGECEAAGGERSGGLRGGARGPGEPRAGGRWGRLAEGRRRFGERGDGSRFPGGAGQPSPAGARLPAASAARGVLSAPEDCSRNSLGHPAGASPARRASSRTGPGGPEGRPGRLAGARPRLAGRPRGGRGGAACSAPGAPQLHAVFSHAFSFCTEKLLQRALCKVGRHPV